MVCVRATNELNHDSSLQLGVEGGGSICAFCYAHQLYDWNKCTLVRMKDLVDSVFGNILHLLCLSCQGKGEWREIAELSRGDDPFPAFHSSREGV